MTDLLTRLAAGPASRELSDEVLAALEWGGGRQNWPAAHMRPHITACMQAVLNAVPEGWAWVCSCWPASPLETQRYRFSMGKVSYDMCQGRAITPALAGCIALVRAKRTQEE